MKVTKSHKEGCYYYIKNDKMDEPIFCENGDKMIDSNGNIYKK